MEFAQGRMKKKVLGAKEALAAGVQRSSSATGGAPAPSPTPWPAPAPFSEILTDLS